MLSNSHLVDFWAFILIYAPCILIPYVFNSCQILFLRRFILVKNILNPTCFEPKIYILWDQGKLSWSNKLDFNWHHLHSSCWFLQSVILLSRKHKDVELPHEDLIVTRANSWTFLLIKWLNLNSNETMCSIIINDIVIIMVLLMVDQHHVTPLAQLTFATKCLDQ